MKHDPIRQADIERRLANLAKAARCGAKTRAGQPCRQAAVRGRSRCRMHGGAKGSGGPRENRNGNFKHGLFTGKAKATRRVMRAKFREIRALIQAATPRAGTGTIENGT
jgi:glucans biosynthesis protein